MKQIESFFWGIIAALGAIIVELFLFIGFSAYSDYSMGFSFSSLYSIPRFIILAACIEEIFKYLIISKRVELISLEKSYIINSFFVGLGFFGVELGLISQAEPFPPLLLLAEIAILHIGTAGIIGYFVATKNPKKLMTFLFVVLIVTIIHATFNLLSLNRNFITNYLILATLTLVIMTNIRNFFSIRRVLAQD